MFLQWAEQEKDAIPENSPDEIDQTGRNIKNFSSNVAAKSFKAAPPRRTN